MINKLNIEMNASDFIPPEEIPKYNFSLKILFNVIKYLVKKILGQRLA